MEFHTKKDVHQIESKFSQIWYFLHTVCWDTRMNTCLLLLLKMSSAFTLTVFWLVTSFCLAILILGLAVLRLSAQFTERINKQIFFIPDTVSI